MSKQKHYPEVDSNPDFPKIETKILEFWQKNNIFQESINSRLAKNKENKNNEFVFYDGPPFANGLPHYGHLLTGFVKDIFARYQTLKGKRVERRFGWDCHGLPAEMGVEKELGISGRTDIVNYGIDKFNDSCRTSVMKYAASWESYVNRQARWVDFKNDYKTMDIGYMESVLWAFKQLYDKGLVYESMRVMPYSWACQTPLSNFETRMDNSYRQRADKAVTVAFKLKSEDKLTFLPQSSNYYIMAWTTTPWTLPSNLALAINQEMDYVAVIKDNSCYILADFAAEKYAKELGLSKDNNINLLKFKGKELLGLNYEPILPYFKNHRNSFKILNGEFVIAGDGTGVVHLAPGFGEDDMLVCQANNIELVCPVDSAGKFIEPVNDFIGLQVFDANDEIIKRLKQDGSWIKTEQYLHNYPHCWRTDTPLIYKALPSWYVKVTEFKDRMVELNKQINWIPEHIKDGQFGKWLENARDWSISRNRFWGSPIPVWKSNNPNNSKLYVFGSIQELEEFFEVKITDLHRPFIDQLTKADPENPKYTLTRVEDVFDCWFESGSMPYAQIHYPFENKDWFENHFPADFIVEYIAQTRGWFYTLMVLSTALFDRPPFKNCICHGVVLDTQGQKLSKRLNNYADPMELFGKYGADSMRMVMVSAPIMHGGELLIDKEGNMVRDAVRLVLKPIWNAYNFFTLYANSDGIKANFSFKSDNLMDQYILAKAKQSIRGIDSALSNYNTPEACKWVEALYEVLNNWYIRRTKERFWKTDYDQDKQNAYNTLYTVQHMMVRAMSPLMPYLAEEIYQGLEANQNISVHLSFFPEVDSIEEQTLLIQAMDRVRDVCNSALSIRNANNIRVRQPLQNLTIVAKDADNIASYEEIIKDELNVKNIIYQTDVKLFADIVLKINFPLVGKRLPAQMKDIIAANKMASWERLSNNKILIAGVELDASEFELNLVPKDKQSSQSLATNDALVVLDLDVTDELKLEGIARDIIRLIQQSRKDAALNVADYINLFINTANETFLKSIRLHQEYIQQQTLAKKINITDDFTKISYLSEHLLEDEKIILGINKI